MVFIDECGAKECGLKFSEFGVDKQKLLDKLAGKPAVIGAVGMGYVGRSLALRYSSIDFKVIGFGVDQAKVALLKSGSSDIEHISDPLNCQPAVADKGAVLSHDDEASDEVMSLPVHPYMETGMIGIVTTVLQRTIESH